MGMLQRIGQLLRQGVNLGIRIHFIRCNTRKAVGTHLGPGLHKGLKIGLQGVIAADEITHRHTYGDRPVAVTEIPVIIHLKQRTHGVIFDGKGIDNGLRRLNHIPQIIVKAVLIDTFSGHGAVEAAKAAAPEGEIPKIDDTALPGQFCPETVDHGLQMGILRGAVRQHQHIARCLLFRRGDCDRNPHGSRCRPGRPLPKPMGCRPDEKIKEILSILSALRGGQILHICRKATNVAKAQITADILNIAVGRHIVKMFGCGDLRGKLTGKIHVFFLQQFNKPMKLAGCQEGVHRIGKE